MEAEMAGRSWRKRVLLLLVAWLLSGCAGMFTHIENPRLSITSLRVLPSTGLEQRVEIALRVLNPNGFALDARGLYLDVRFNEISVLSGVAADPPTVEPYSEAEMRVTLSTSLVNSIRVIAAMANDPEGVLRYRLEARLDLDSPFARRLSVVEQGEIAPARSSTGTF